MAEIKAFGGQEKNFAQSKDSKLWQEQKKQQYHLALAKQQSGTSNYMAPPTAPLSPSKPGKSVTVELQDEQKEDEKEKIQERIEGNEQKLQKGRQSMVKAPGPEVSRLASKSSPTVKFESAEPEGRNSSHESNDESEGP